MIETSFTLPAYKVSYHISMADIHLHAVTHLFCISPVDMFSEGCFNASIVLEKLLVKCNGNWISGNVTLT